MKTYLHLDSIRHLSINQFALLASTIGATIIVGVLAFLSGKRREKTISTEITEKNTTEQEPTPQEPMDWSDYFIGGIFVVVGIFVAALVGWFYWGLHGGSVDNFAFWTTGDKKWLEILFWSFFTTHAWNVTTTALFIAKGEFQKRYMWEYLGRILETPPISLALVFIIINLGVTFGEATVSLSQAPITVVIAFAIISAYFSREAVEGLQVVADWFASQLKNRFKILPTDNASTTVGSAAGDSSGGQ